MPVPDNYEVTETERVNAEKDLNPLEWEIRTITDVDVVRFDRDDGGTDERIAVKIDPPIGKSGVSFICNRTRERALTKACGTPRVADWVGHQIAIRQGSTTFMGKQHKIVEIADVSPKSLKTKKTNPHELTGDDIPY